MTLQPSILATLVFDNAEPRWFWLLLVCGALLVLYLTYRGIYRRSGRRLTWALMAMRALGVLALLISLVKPAWVTRQTQEQRPVLAVVLDDSQSMQVPHRGGGSRFAAARQLLTVSPQGADLHRRFDLELHDLAGRRIGMDDLPAEPAAEHSDLLRPLRDVARQMRGRHAAGVVLISDGRDTTGRPDLMALESYPLPLFTIGFSPPVHRSQDRPVDLALVNVEAPQRAIVHNQLAVRLVVSKDSGPAIQTEVAIERAGQVVHRQPLELAPGAVRQAVDVPWTPQEAGDFVMTARLGTLPQESQTDNNAQLFRLRVDATPIRLLYIEGVLRSEYSYLVETLRHDPDLDLITFVRTASPDAAAVPGVLLGGELVTPQRLKKVDVVLLGDFEARMLDDQAYAALRAWVEEGGGLMVLGGYRNLGQVGLGRTALADLLPVRLGGGESAAVDQLEEPIPFRLTEEGRRHPALRLTGDMGQDTALWELLPQLRGMVVTGPAKPGATVLASYPASTALRRDLVVLAAQPAGKGQVAILTADSTWRWSRIPRLMGRPDTLYSRFWGQMIRWLAHRPIEDDRPALTVATDAAQYERGQQVRITVRRNRAAVIPVDAGEEQTPAGTGQEEHAGVTVRWPDGRTSSVPLTPATVPGQWTGSFFPARGGRFEVSARLAASPAPGSEGQATVASSVTEFQVQGSSLELQDPTPSPAVMAQMARITGGLYADIADTDAMDQLLTSLPSQPRVLEQTRRASLWNSPVLFLVFLACVTVEWIVRRRHQLV